MKKALCEQRDIKIDIYAVQEIHITLKMTLSLSCSINKLH